MYRINARNGKIQQSSYLTKKAPKPISLNEWTEILQIPKIQEAWGVSQEITPEEFASVCYGARFDFVSGSPGYCGDLYMIYGDAISGVPIALIRNSENRLEILVDN